ncbi:hypothetical protein NP603_11470 [Methylomonas sp. SURF-1]|uniref:Tetratricopeptide repeat protein n=1 Tax=Methylomonas aurea TaxID=2952224 RepID=A0ABT1UJ85_9GAMM|nr:hypothetical protein [Methylomonas sp. SURF-1]MCQ8181730.1 hypothetical protein [Methylomonas sp. SURF-1]
MLMINGKNLGEGCSTLAARLKSRLERPFVIVILLLASQAPSTTLAAGPSTSSSDAKPPTGLDTSVPDSVSQYPNPPAASVSSVENADWPKNRYAKCRAQPSMVCLFEQVAENLPYDSPDGLAHRNGFSLTALALGVPEWARKTHLLDTNSNYNRYSWLAEPTSLLARAQWALGLNSEAQRSATQAFDIAFTKRKGTSRATYLTDMESVLPLFLVGDSPVSADKAMSYFNFAKTEQVPNAFRILENAAIAQARHGNIQEAAQLAEILSAEANAGTVSLSGLRVFKDKQPGLYTSVMLALAEGRLDRGDTAAAREALGELEQSEPYFLKETQLAARAGVLYARLGETDKAVGAVRNITRPIFQSGMDGVAVALCKANRYDAGQALAEKIVELEKAMGFKIISSITKAKLAKIAFFCGNPEKAKTDFVDALTIANDFHCSTDSCTKEYRYIKNMKLDVLATGWLEPIWQRGRFEDPLISLKIAVQRAEQGDALAALARLDELAAIYPGNHGDGFPHLFALAKAQVLAVLGRNSEMETELATARSIAVNYDHHRRRARGLLEIAETLLKLKQTDKAQVYAKEAANELAKNMSTGQGQFVYSTPGDEGIVKLLAQTGADTDALHTAWSFLEPDRHGQLVDQKQPRQKVLTEIALAQFKQEPNTQLLEAISKIESLSDRMNSWRQALTIAASLENDEGQDFVKSALRGELQNLPESLKASMKPSDRRQAIHSSATLLQAHTLVIDEAQKLSVIQELAESARAMTENQYGAKALCELAYTAHAIRQPALASAWFEEAKTRADKKYYSYNFPIEESPLGACAYWAKTAGNTELANTLAAELQKLMPEKLDNIASQIHTLLNVAIAYAEYEKGEIFWAEYGR